MIFLKGHFFQEEVVRRKKYTWSGFTTGYIRICLCMELGPISLPYIIMCIIVGESALDFARASVIIPSRKLFRPGRRSTQKIF